MSPRGAPRPPHASPTAAHPVFRPWYDPRAPYLVPLVLALAARLDFARRLHFAAEDAYITFRYAENWAHGLGPVYNAGERVMGFSSPLWTAWLASGAALHAPLLAWARTWSVGFDLGALVLMAALLSREAGRASAWAFAGFFAVFPLFSANAVLGMETSLLVFLLAAAACAIQARRGTLAGVALGALALTRPEGFAVALVVAWFAPPRARIVAGAIALAGLGALTAYFGSPVPQSVTAKALTYGVGQRGFALAWIEGFLPAFFHHRWQDLLEGQHLFAVSVVTLPAAVLGVAALARGRRVAFAVALGGLLVLLGYCVLGVPYFGWYYVLPLFGWATAAAAGLPLVIRSRLVWAALALYIGTDAPFLAILYEGRNDGESRVFGTVADALTAASGGHGTVFLEPIGRIGEQTGLTVIDEVGLVSPDVARRRAQGAGWYADVVDRRRPDFLVVRAMEIDANQPFAGVGAPFRSQAERDATLSPYAPVGPAPTAKDALWILKRRPETAP
jgi:arabinofuranosyltransferase